MVSSHSSLIEMILSHLFIWNFLVYSLSVTANHFFIITPCSASVISFSHYLDFSFSEVAEGYHLISPSIFHFSSIFLSLLKVILFWLSLIFCITTYHPSLRLWICLCYEVIQTCLQLSRPLFSPNHSFIRHHHWSSITNTAIAPSFFIRL